MKKLLIFICIAAFLSGCGAKDTPPAETVLVESAAPSQTPIPSSPTPTIMPKSIETAPVKTQEAMPKATIEATPSPSPVQTADTVKISITGIDDNTDILPLTETEFEEGQSVFEVLLSVTRERKIQMEYSGGKKTAYIKGVNNLYEFDKGGSSGWMYSVNGEIPQKSCGSYIVKKGDIIEIKYTTELGKFN